MSHSKETVRRRRISNELSFHQPKTTKAIGDAIDVPAAAVNGHLVRMKDAGLIVNGPPANDRMKSTTWLLKTKDDPLRDWQRKLHAAQVES